MALIHFGVREETAFSLSNDARAAMLIIFNELNGAEFSWESGKWIER